VPADGRTQKDQKVKEFNPPLTPKYTINVDISQGFGGLSHIKPVHNANIPGIPAHGSVDQGCGPYPETNIRMRRFNNGIF
jgi:hypothetical protein